MGVLKKPFISKNKPDVLSESSEESYDDIDNVFFVDDPGDEEILQDPPKRAYGRRVEREPNEDEPETTTAKTKPAVPSQKAADKKVRLSADISKALHRRLKLFSINTDQTILTIIESWIMKYCPK